MKNFYAFTLAEAMITLVIVGIVAAATVPTLMHNYSQRVNSERHANIVYKMATAMHNMKNQGELNGKFDTTMDFVNRLKKYIKIDKICDSDHIAECWSTKTVTTRSGAKYNVADAKTRADNNTMGGLAFIFDVNGNGGPNKQQVRKVGKEHRDVLDIRGFQGARFDAKNVPEFGCVDFVDYKHYEMSDGKCYFAAPNSMTWNDAMAYTCPGDATNLSAQYNQTTLISTCNTIRQATNNANPLYHNSYWSSQTHESNSNSAYGLYFGHNFCSNGGYSGKNANFYVLCAR